jgi:Domain of unknown function (DUF4173)
MKSNRLKFYTVLIGAFLFNLLFWQEKMGLNTLFYDAFLLTALFSLYPEARPVSTVRWLLAGHLICLAMVLLQNTVISMIAVSITLLLLVSFVQYVHRSAWYAAGSIFENMIFSVPNIFETLQKPSKAERPSRGIGKWIRFLIIPIGLLFVFFLLYIGSNNVFADLIEKAIDKLTKLFFNFFDFISWDRAGMLLLGLFISTVLLLKSKLGVFSKAESKLTDILGRKRVLLRDRKQGAFYQILFGFLGKFASGIMALKNINTVGVLSLVFLNLLLLVVNCIDISYIWFGYHYGDKVNLYEMIHEGTGVLIFSILLAIVVLLLVFKGNLNFYEKNKWLKRGAYIWIIQNAILVISVFLRDYYYIYETGLAYKRIGVIFYLLLVLVGLVTVFWKIYKKKTIYYLLRVNAWAVIVLLVVASTINWDRLIASYNISHHNSIVIPVDYMVTLSDEALDILDQNRSILKEHISMREKQGIKWPFRNDLDQTIDERIKYFNKYQSAYSWLSWNLSDQQLKAYFSSQTVKQ